ncbi:MAG: SDR family oxidoreductase [Planctomycetia bacterium]|nr:SDR family oxidoreductase [Planctomycetia bacterium]
MKYTALTGATGLLGSYLLKDLLRADVPVVVLVRSSKMETAKERIEAIVRRHERLLNRPLPRPIIMESNLHKPALGLDSEQRSWFKKHVDTMLHNAASLSFIAEENGEPYRSNIDGTRNVLELCEETGIRRFFHVSTAYVCGLRKGIILESELNRDQEFGNDYEKSKFTSENMVRNAPHLDSVTVFRPAIIVGDSITGYTSTFHGFYTPMKILVPLIDPKYVDVETVLVFGQAIGMNPNDQKNFVPVDWISKVMVEIIQKPAFHDSCYHLAASNRVRIDEMSRCIAEGIIQYKKSGKSISSSNGLEIDRLLTLFHEQMTVYQAYWKDDPVFDMSNTIRAVPQFPPMEMDKQLLMNLVRFAIESQFGWPKPKKVELGFESEEVFKRSRLEYKGLLETNIKRTNSSLFGLRIAGPGGGDWSIRFENGPSNTLGTYDILVGLPSEKAPLLSMNTNVFQRYEELYDSQQIMESISWESGSMDECRNALLVLKTLVKKQEFPL